MTTFKIPPLEQRIYRSKAKGIVLPSPIKVPCRPKAYGLWTQESLDQAVAAVERGTSVRRAAEMFGVPRSTVHDHASGKVEQFAKQGPKPYLTTEEEEELASFLVRCARIGYPHTRQQVIGIVQNVVNSKNMDVVITSGWWERFRQRHPYLTLRTAVPLSYVRAMASDSDSIDRYYDLLEETLKSNDIYNDPTHIFNCDETGMPLNPKPLKIVGEVGAKSMSKISGNSKSQITVLACTSAAGYPLPPFVVWDRKTLTKQLTKGEVPGAAYGLSSKGWMDMELFRDWFIGHFLSYAPACRPLLLLLDGHSSHFCPEVIRAAAAEGVIIFALPPNTTHLSQPLDKGVFAPLKIEWRKVVQDFISKNPGRDITRYDFSALFAKAWNKAMSLANITAGFRVTGICPFNRNAISLPSEEPKSRKFNPEALPQATGIKYIPLYSPAHSKQKKHTGASLGKNRSPPPSPVEHDQSNRYLDFSDYSLSHYSSTPMQLGQGKYPLSIQSISSDNSLLERSSSEPCISEHLTLKKQPCLRKFLCTPRPPSKIPTVKPKLSGRVLTSLENMKIMEERELKKKEEARLKDERKRAREEKKKQKEEHEKWKKAKSSCLSRKMNPNPRKKAQSTSEGYKSGASLNTDKSGAGLYDSIIISDPILHRGSSELEGTSKKSRFKSEEGLDESSISSDEPLLSPIAPRAPSTKPGSQGTSKKPGMTIQKTLRIGIRSGKAGCKSVAALDDSSVRSDKPQLPFPAPQAPSAKPGGQDPSKKSGSKSRVGLDSRVSRGKPRTSPVPREPAKPGGQGTFESVTLQKLSLSSGRSSPLTSPVLQEPAKRGGRGTSKSVTLQKMSLRSGRSSPLISPVLQEPAKRGGRGTSKSVTLQKMSLRSGRSSESGSKSRADLDGRVSRSKPLTSPVLQGPTKPGGRGTSTSVTLQKMSLRSGRSSPLISPVLQGPAKRGGRGTSKSVTLQKMSLRSGRSSESGSKCRAGLDGRVNRGKPLTSVLQGPAKPGGQGTSKGVTLVNQKMSLRNTSGRSSGSKSGASLDNGSTSSDEFPFSPPSQLSTKPKGRDNAKRCQSTRTASLCISSEDEQELSGDKGTLDDRDLAPLYSGGQLTSTIIACYQHLLKGKYNAIGGLEDPAYGLEYDFSTQRGFFVQVLHVNGDHWIVASNMNCKPGHIRVFDSIHDDISTDTINQICCIVRSKRSKIKIDIMDVCKQKGTNDCGLYALANATVLCEGELPQLKDYVQQDMRPHLQECLKNCTPYPFPSNHRDRHRDDIKKTMLVSLHCKCRLPEHPDKKMIQCINCEVWYHDDCEVVEPKAWKDEDYPWKCRKCINRSDS